MSFCEKNLGGVIPVIHLGHDDAKLLAKINQELKEYEENLEKIKWLIFCCCLIVDNLEVKLLYWSRLKDGIKNILNISRVGNQYLQAKKPWVLIKGTDEEK